MIFFFLLRPVSKEINLLAAFLRFVSIVFEAAASLALVVALHPLGKAAALKAFTPEQLAVASTLAIRVFEDGLAVALLFLGGCFVVRGRSIFGSGYLPRALCVLTQIAGVGYLIDGFTLILATGPFSANRA